MAGGEVTQALEEVLKGHIDPKNGALHYDETFGKRLGEWVLWVQTFDMNTLHSKEEKLAFWINTYNLLAIHTLVTMRKKGAHVSKDVLKSFLARRSFFVSKKHLVCGRWMSLKNIEESIRNEYNDPRVYFALSVLTKSSPPLRPYLYTPTNIDKELALVTLRYINSPKGVMLDRMKRRVYFPAIFKQHKAEFAAKAGSVLNFVLPYLPAEQREYIENNRNRLTYAYRLFNWELNVVWG